MHCIEIHESIMRKRVVSVTCGGCKEWTQNVDNWKISKGNKTLAIYPAMLNLRAIKSWEREASLYWNILVNKSKWMSGLEYHHRLMDLGDR